jgi:hypothetical protein
MPTLFFRFHPDTLALGDDDDADASIAALADRLRTAFRAIYGRRYDVCVTPTLRWISAGATAIDPALPRAERRAIEAEMEAIAEVILDCRDWIVAAPADPRAS